MPVILVNKVVDPKRIIRKMEGRGGGEAQGVADQKKTSGKSGFQNGRTVRCRLCECSLTSFYVLESHKESIL
jgi:hypothetical protein